MKKLVIYFFLFCSYWWYPYVSLCSKPPRNCELYITLMPKQAWIVKRSFGRYYYVAVTVHGFSIARIRKKDINKYFETY
jgi:hypothetical protein